MLRFIIFFLMNMLLTTVCMAQDFSPEIQISGGDSELEANIRSHLSLAGESCDSTPARLDRIRAGLLDSIRQAGRALGYYRNTYQLQFSEQDSCWSLLIDITQGERILVASAKVEIRGEEELRNVFQEVLDDRAPLEGLPLHHGNYEALKTALVSRAQEAGFFSASFATAEIRLDLSAYEAEIVLDFVPGPRFSFGAINVMDVDGLSRDFVNSLVILQEGEAFSSERLLAQRLALDETRFFQHIDVIPQLSQADNQRVPVDIEVQLRPRHAYMTGIGFTTDTGPRARVAYENRYLNSFGHMLDVDASFSTVRSQVNTQYSIPLPRDPVRQRLMFGTGFISEDNDSYESDRFKLEAAWRKEFDNGWINTLFIDFLQDDYRIDEQVDKSELTMLGNSMSKTSADNVINTVNGWNLFMQFRGASDSMLSDTSFLQIYGSGKKILTFGDSRLLLRGELGATLVDRLQDLPASVRFYAGGDKSIRGYDYQSLGPLNDSGEVTGGKHLLTSSIEIDHLFKNRWRGAVFYDGGNAFSSDKFEWEHSVGIGLRWLSPIGPIRLDLARGFGEKGAFRIHVTMGPDL